MILTLDYGTSALKAALYDGACRPLAACAREWRYAYPALGHIEHPARAYWDASVDAARELLSRFPDEPLSCVNLTGQAETLIFLDAHGEPLSDAIVWLDTRAQAECEQLSREYGADALYARTGNTGFDPVMPVCKLRHLRRAHPELLEGAAKILLLKEYIYYRLTGEFAGEDSVSSCTAYLDIRAARYDASLLAAAEVGEDRLAPIADSGHMGRLCEAARRELGAGEGARVGVGLLDQCAASIGAGAVEEGMVTEATGTALAIAASMRAFEPERWPEKLFTLRHALPNRFLALPNAPTGGALLKWFRDEFAPGGYEEINREIEARGREHSGLILLPHFAGYLCPVSNPSARGVLYGLSLDTRRADVALAIMEGVAFLVRENLELLARCGVEAREVLCLGGGAKSEPWLRAKANILNRPVSALADDEATSLGCACFAAFSLGEMALSDIPKLVQTRKRFAPSAQGARVYEARYALYLDLNRRLGFNPPEQTEERL